MLWLPLSGCLVAKDCWIWYFGVEIVLWDVPACGNLERWIKA